MPQIELQNGLKFNQKIDKLARREARRQLKRIPQSLVKENQFKIGLLL
jgi:hypothetical protein